MSYKRKECEYDPDRCDIYIEFNEDLFKAQAARIEALETVIRQALSIKDIWTYGEVAPEYEGEAEALNKMMRSFEDVLK